MTRDELIEAGARSLYGIEEEGPSEEAAECRQGCRSLAEDIIDAVEDLIRADERQRSPIVYEREIPNDGLIVAKALAYDGLRAKVDALRGEVYGRSWIRRDDVLALLDGGSDD